MQFRVGAAPSVADTSYAPALGTPLRTGARVINRLVNPRTGTLTTTAQVTRSLTLNEVMGPPTTVVNPVTGVLTAYPGGPLEILVNNTKYMGTDRKDFTRVEVGGMTSYYSEVPQEGSTEVWELINMTADAHPIHLHLAQFQVLNRQSFSSKYVGVHAAAFGSQQDLPPLLDGCQAGAYCPGYGPPLRYDEPVASGGKLGGNPDVTPWLSGPILPPAPHEAGWKDTVISYPGQVTRLAIRWAPTDRPVSTDRPNLHFAFDPSNFSGHGYVWHCHIIDYEDDEMMRPDIVSLNTDAPPASERALRPGIEY